MARFYLVDNYNNLNEFIIITGAVEYDLVYIYK